MLAAVCVHLRISGRYTDRPVNPGPMATTKASLLPLKVRWGLGVHSAPTRDTILPATLILPKPSSTTRFCYIGASASIWSRPRAGMTARWRQSIWQSPLVQE